MLWMFSDFLIEVLNRAAGGGDDGSIPITYLYDHGSNMTSDGIETKEWEVVQDYAAKIANAVCADEDHSAEEQTQALLTYLDCLETKYGKLPSILATRADYVIEAEKRVLLLDEAYSIAKLRTDTANMRLIAASLAQHFIEEAGDARQGQLWLACFADAIGNKWDDVEYADFRALSQRLEQLGKKGRNSIG